MAYAYKNLKAPINTGSGVADYVLLAPVSWFEEDGINCPVAPFTLPGDEVTVKVPHTFLAGKAFVKYALAPEKNQLDAKTIGDKGFQKLDQELKIFVPGSYAELHEAMKNWMNTPLIALTKDSNCSADMFYMLGCDCVFAYMSIDFSTGTTKDGVKGYTATVSYLGGSILLYKVTGGPAVMADA